MPQSLADQLKSIQMSPNLGQSFGRAREFAREQSHRALLLEHVLLALTEDPEASGVLRACNVDIVRLSTDVSGYLGRLTEDMRAEPGIEPTPDPELMRVLEAARQAAQQSRRGAIDGSIVLAAIVGDGKSPAAGLLKTHGMTFDEAIRTLQKASAQARSKQYSPSAARAQPEKPAASKTEVEAPAPAPARPAASAPSAPAEPGSSGQSADEILAAARARIQQRSPGAAAKPESKPAAELPPSEPDLPLMNLAQFRAAPTPPTPGPSDLPPPVARASDGAGLPPLPASPAPPLPGGPPHAPLEAHLPPPRTFQRPSDGAPRPPPPPRRPERSQRGDRPEGAEPPPLSGGRPVAANGMAAGPRWPAVEGARPPARPPPAPRAGQRSAAGPLMEAIPRRMRVGTAASAQVRIGRDKVDNLMQLLAGGRLQPADAVANVLSVRLRAPDGGFSIEAATPETQWIEAAPRLQPEDHVGWRWTVTPLRRGRRRLQLLVAARTVGHDGIGPETAPPDRTIEVTVKPNRLRRLLRGVFLLAVFGLGAGLGVLSQDKLAQDAVDLGSSAVKNLLGLLRTSGFLGG